MSVMPMMSYDTIVIGGGHNGLVAATLLAKSGRKVGLFEAANQLGGAARGHEFHPGFTSPGLAHVLNRLHSDVVRELGLAHHGLTLKTANAPTVALALDGEHLVLRGSYGASVEGNLPSSEIAAWQSLRKQLFRHASILKRLFDDVPPPLSSASAIEILKLAKTGLALRLLGKVEMREFMRMILMPVADVANEHLSDERLKGLLAFDATLGVHLGPRSPTSLLGLYYRLAGELDGVVAGQAIMAGGMEHVIAALEKSACLAGVTIRTGATVARVLIEGEAVKGILLADGSEVSAPLVVSGLSPVTTFMSLVGPRHLDTGFVRAIGNIRIKGDTSKLHIALDCMPRFSGLAAADHAGRLVIAPTSDHVERSFNPTKYGELPEQPVMEITLPSMLAQAAPDGACVLSANIQHTPYDLKQGWPSAKPEFYQRVLTILEKYAPGIRKTVMGFELLSPPDIEARYLMPGGHWHHGELQADQMMTMRPTYAASRYATPILGLYLCSAGSHPGGGISGMPGLLAARTILKSART